MSALGKIAYYGWHRPRTFVTEFFAENGFVHGRINQWHGSRMRAAARRLAALPVAEGPHHAAHYLTGRTFWHLTAIAAYSLQQHTAGRIQPVFHSDGRLDEATVRQLRAIFPAAEFVTDARQQELLAQYVPASRYPVLRRLWGEFVLIRKLLSVHLGRPGWNLFLDSDTVFVRRPDYLLAWYDRPEQPLCMEDLLDCYGYDRPLLDRLAGHALPPRVNTGLIGLHSPALDLDRLEYFAREMTASKGLDHFLEQAMTAMLLAGRPFAYAPRADYYSPLTLADCLERRGVFQHYAGPARKWFYRHAWRLVVPPTQS
jgi:hypothetical protein